MNAPASIVSETVRVTRIRSATRRGCIAFGYRIDTHAGINDRSSAVVILVPASIGSPSDVTVGGIYEVYGDARVIRREYDGFQVSETQIDVQQLRLISPSGSQLIQWLADNIPHIGEVKATKLWDALGERLYEILDDGDHSALIKVLPSQEVRDGLFEGWTKNGDRKTLRFVQDKGIPLDLARKAIKFHKTSTVAALTEDPYRLISFEGSWTRVDAIAREKFGVQLDDQRRLSAALEEILYRVSSSGHTCATLSDLTSGAAKLLRPYKAPNELLAKALNHGRTIGQFVALPMADGDMMLYAPGAFILERTCAEFIKSLLQDSPSSQRPLFATHIGAVIRDFEFQERVHLGVPEYTLNNAQRRAVETSFGKRFSVITGGAGVGKTTVLKALYKALDTLGRPRFQMALSGRATARMIEATQEPAWTIASFLRKVDQRELGDEPVIVIDEASMLDVLTFFRLANKLPAASHLVLVGDPYQLPPIGAGLVLHVLCKLSNVPSVELTEVRRQSQDSLIPSAAKAVRDGEWPKFSSEEGAEVVFLPCEDRDIISTVMRLYDTDPNSTQILGATRACLFAGVQTINKACHASYANQAKPLLAANSETGVIEATGFCEGDLLLYTKNDWARNLQNGCLGTLTKVYEEPQMVNIGDEELPVLRSALGEAIIEGAFHHILESDIDHLDHAYAITVHKAQGSQFPRVIVPIRKSRVLDRTFIYTAITRAQKQVILVGDVQAAQTAVELPPKAFSRQVGLDRMLALQESESVPC